MSIFVTFCQMHNPQLALPERLQTYCLCEYQTHWGEYSKQLCYFFECSISTKTPIWLRFNQAICSISYCHSVQHKQTFLCSLGLYIEPYSQKSVQFGWCNLHGAITNHRNGGIDSLNDREDHYNQPYVQHGVDKHTFGILKSRFR